MPGRLYLLSGRTQNVFAAVLPLSHAYHLKFSAACVHAELVLFGLARHLRDPRYPLHNMVDTHRTQGVSAVPEKFIGRFFRFCKNAFDEPNIASDADANAAFPSSKAGNQHFFYLKK